MTKDDERNADGQFAAAPLLGDDEIWNKNGNCVCRTCGKESLGLGWPTPRLCNQCGRKRDMTEPKACPFCGCSGIFRIKENDSSAYWIECAVCHSRGPRVELEGLAMYQWNRRKSPNEKLTDAGPKTPGLA